MKKTIFKIAFVIAIPIVMLINTTSCAGYLDVDKYFYDQLSLDSAFSKRVYVEGWLSNAYQHLEQDCGEMVGNFKFASDDMITYDQEGCKDYQFSNYNATTQLSENQLGRLYETVRKASTFIDNVDRCPELSYSEISDYQGQGRFLRAYAYWALLRKYGPVPLLPEEGLDVSLSYEELSLPRAHFDDVVDFIEQDLISAARTLDTRRAVNNLGRPTRGAALALRARVLLHAASPLFNGNIEMFNVKDNTGKQLISQEADESKWAKAAAAAKEVIDLGRYRLHIVAPQKGTPAYERPPLHADYSLAEYPNGWSNVDPYASYKHIFDGTIQGSKNEELIFTRTSNGGSVSNLAKDGVPRTLQGNNKVGVTQKMVDAYYMNDGRTILEAEQVGDYERIGFTQSSNPEEVGGYPFVPIDVSLMYTKREPRFYASIAFNGSIWECESATESSYQNYQAFYYRNLNDGKQGFKEECPLTGIGLRKYYNREDAYTTGGFRTAKTEQTIRYAEILLIYAEALNELTPGKSYTFKTYNEDEVSVQYDPAEMKYAIKQIRMRAGLPEYPAGVYDNQNEFRTRLKKERQIELFAENSFRYYDLRRWKDAAKEEDEPIMGCNINISDDAASIQRFYTPTVVSSVPKVFLTKMYLWPFPHDELKRNINLTQNPGW